MTTTQPEQEYGKLRSAVLAAGFPPLQLEELELLLGKDHHALQARFQEWQRVFGNLEFRSIN